MEDTEDIRDYMIENLKLNGVVYVPESSGLVAIDNPSSPIEPMVAFAKSMLINEKWQTLSKNAQVLYIYCLAEWQENKRKEFTLNREKWLNCYKIYKSDNGQFYKDIKCLIDNGFIEIAENGAKTRSPNIYRLIDNWKG